MHMHCNPTKALIAVALTMLFTAPASAQFTVVQAGGAFGENVLFPGPDQFGSHVDGSLNATGFHVNVDSTQLLHADGGQALVEAIDDLATPDLIPLTNLSVSLDPDFVFTDFIFNAYRDGWGGTVNVQFTVDYITPAGQSNSGVFTINNGSNFFTVTSDPGFFLKKVTLNVVPGGTAPAGEYGLMDARQLRINNARHISSVPEPGSLAMLAGGGLPLFGLLRRFRKR